MKVTVLEECGYDHALRGMAYSFKDRALDPDSWWEGQRAKAEKRAPLLAPKEGGHNKFLESIAIWIDLEAPRSFWQEFDTYRVGTTKQSESTMHTLSKRRPTSEDFEVDTPPRMIEAFMAEWDDYQEHKNLSRLKEGLPEGFLQRRVVVTNYKVLRNVLWQRGGHRYKRWGEFVAQLLPQLQHPSFVTSVENGHA